MNCHRLSNLLSAYIDGELTGVEMIEIRRHLEDCPDCQAELDCLRATKRMVGRLRMAQPAPDFAGRICASLEDVRPYSWLAAWTRLWHAPLQKASPAIACVGLAFLALITFTHKNLNEDIQIAAAQHHQSLAPISEVSLEWERPRMTANAGWGTRLNEGPVSAGYSISPASFSPR